MIGRYIPIFGLNSLIIFLGEFFLFLPNYENDIAWHFEVVKSQGRSSGFANIL